MTYSIGFTATFGITPGYALDDDFKDSDEGPAIDAWMRAIEAERREYGTQVSAMVSKQRVLYPVDYGCPMRGETVIVFTGASNPDYVAALQYQHAVERVVAAVKAELKQERVTLTFATLRRHVYFDGDKIKGFG